MSGFIFSTDQSVMSYYRVLRAYFDTLVLTKVIRDKDILLTTKIDQILTLGKSSMYDEQDQWIVEFTFIYTTRGGSRI
jgi:lipoate-protein ligase B